MIVNAVATVAENFYDEENNNRKENFQLRTWLAGCFKGDEAFDVVATKLNQNFNRIGDYLSYILKIPLIDSFIQVMNGKYQRGLLVTLLMSLDCLSKLALDSKNTSTVAMDTNHGRSKDRNVPSAEEREIDVEWKKTFYEVYETKFKSMSNSTLIDRTRYDHIVGTLLTMSAKGPDQKLNPAEKRFKRKYMLLSNIKNRCLHRKGTTGNWLLVPTYEEIFDIMKSHHENLSHAKDYDKNKKDLDKVWYSIPESCIKIFLNLCPRCFSGSSPARKSRMNPLKFIHSPRVGHRAQIDLIKMESQPYDGYNYILRYVDHLSGFSHVAPLKTMNARPIGMKILEILSGSIIPEILQSDNGSEFLGDCIAILKKYYPGVHIVKGRPRHPQSQGKIERGHAAFKNALQKWMSRTGDDNWVVGCFIVNKELNQVPQFNRGGFSPYNLYFGKHGTQKTIVNFGEIALKNCNTEYGVVCARELCIQAKRLKGSRQLGDNELRTAMKKGTFFLITFVEFINHITNLTIDDHNSNC